MAVEALICVVVGLYLVYAFVKQKSRGKLPDGPRGIPFFGNVLQFGRQRFVVNMAELGKKYGDAYTVNLFGERVVILNSFDIIKEAMTSAKYAEAFAGRQPTFAVKYIIQNSLTLQQYSNELALARKIVHRGLKTYGGNMAHIEELVQKEIKNLLERIENEGQKSLDPWNFVNGYITSVISILISGNYLNHHHKEIQLLTDIVDGTDYMYNQEIVQLTTLLPWLRYIPVGCGKVYKKLKSDINALKKKLEERKTSTEEKDTDRQTCFSDFMFEEQTKHSMLTDQYVLDTMVDILTAGVATSRPTLYSAFFILTARPDVQKRIQDEIDNVVGRSRLPCSSDRPSMPFAQAVLLEHFRLYQAVPLTIPRLTLEDVAIRDYYIPKDTVIFYNSWGIHHDEHFWEDAYVFNPARFLDDKGNLLPPEDERRHRLLTFGLGKRQCVGEHLARLRIFLAIVSVLQKFNLKPDPLQPLPDIDPRSFNSKLLLTAPPYKIYFEPRDHKN